MSPPCHLVIKHHLAEAACTARPPGGSAVTGRYRACDVATSSGPSQPPGGRRRARARCRRVHSHWHCGAVGGARWPAGSARAKPGPRPLGGSALSGRLGVAGNYTVAPGPRPATGAGTGRRVSWTAGPCRPGNCDKARMRLQVPHTSCTRRRGLQVCRQVLDPARGKVRWAIGEHGPMQHLSHLGDRRAPRHPALAESRF